VQVNHHQNYFSTLNGLVITDNAAVNKQYPKGSQNSAGRKKGKNGME
jgi:hypothetical protein